MPVACDKVIPLILMDNGVHPAIQELCRQVNLALGVIASRAQHVTLQIAQLRSLVVDEVKFAPERSAPKRPNHGISDCSDADQYGRPNIGSVNCQIASGGLGRKVESRKYSLRGFR